MIRIYRVENEDGVGPYNNRYKTEAEILLTDSYLWKHSDCACHPSPQNSSEMMLYRWEWEDQYYAFRTMANLRRWFKGLGVPLLMSGYCVSVYEVPDKFYDIGKSGQVSFVRARSRLVRTLSVEKILTQSYANPDHYYPEYETAQEESQNEKYKREQEYDWTPTKLDFDALNKAESIITQKINLKVEGAWV